MALTVTHLSKQAAMDCWMEFMNEFDYRSLCIGKCCSQWVQQCLGIFLLLKSGYMYTCQKGL